MPTYKKRQGSDTWHWCKNCHNYPKGAGVTSRETKPTGGDLCNECKAKTRDKNCRA